MTQAIRPIPTKLNFGSGKSFKEDFLNIDIVADREPDLLFDLNNPFPFNQPLELNRFGTQAIAPGHFDYILADNVMEHIQELITAMTSCLELLKVGGILEVIVPYDLSYGAWQDPTHVRAFNERSWEYYCDHCWYIGWWDYRFTVEHFTYNINAYGAELLAEHNNNLERVAKFPRAVDSMTVKLKKVQTNDWEKSIFTKWKNGGL